MSRAVYFYGVTVNGLFGWPERHTGAIQSDRPLTRERVKTIIVQRDDSIPPESELTDFLYTEWRLDGDGYLPNGDH